jgi:hypothetical protein
MQQGMDELISGFDLRMAGVFAVGLAKGELSK